MHALSFTQSQAATDAIAVSSSSSFRTAAAFGRDRMVSDDWTCRGDHGQGAGTIRNEVVTKPQTALNIKSEGDSKIRSSIWTPTRKRTSIKNV